MIFRLVCCLDIKKLFLCRRNCLSNFFFFLNKNKITHIRIFTVEIVIYLMTTSSKFVFMKQTKIKIGHTKFYYNNVCVYALKYFTFNWQNYFLEFMGPQTYVSAKIKTLHTDNINKQLT